MITMASLYSAQQSILFAHTCTEVQHSHRTDAIAHIMQQQLLQSSKRTQALCRREHPPAKRRKAAE